MLIMRLRPPEPRRRLPRRRARWPVGGCCGGGSSSSSAATQHPKTRLGDATGGPGQAMCAGGCSVALHLHRGVSAPRKGRAGGGGGRRLQLLCSGRHCSCLSLFSLRQRGQQLSDRCTSKLACGSSAASALRAEFRGRLRRVFVCSAPRARKESAASTHGTHTHSRLCAHTHRRVPASVPFCALSSS